MVEECAEWNTCEAGKEKFLFHEMMLRIIQQLGQVHCFLVM